MEFRQGQIEDLPLPDASVDVVISNCVIDLSVDEPAVLAETFRVLVPGGRIGISDIVAEDHMSLADRAAAGSYAGCIAGALSRAEYLDGLTAAGFAGASVTFTTEAAPGLHSAIIRAVKPVTTRPRRGSQGEETAARRGARRATRSASWARAASKLPGSPAGTGSGMDQCTAEASASSS